MPPLVRGVKDLFSTWYRTVTVQCLDGCFCYQSSLLRHRPLKLFPPLLFLLGGGVM